MNRAILFDCDSTLSTIEGIDVLAEQAGVVDQVVPLTTAAMDGRLKLEDAYAARLDLIRPDAAAIEALGQRYIDTRVAGACKAVAALRALGWQVHVVSGGIRQAVGSLDRVKGIVRSLNFVVCTPEFQDVHKVSSGLSDLFVEVFDDDGKLVTEEVEITATGPQPLQAVGLGQRGQSFDDLFLFHDSTLVEIYDNCMSSLYLLCRRASARLAWVQCLWFAPKAGVASPSL